MKAYKATYNGICINIKYEVGKTYTLNGEIIFCLQGFHFCKKPDDVTNYYNINKEFQLLEIDPLGEVIEADDKAVTDKFKVLRIIPKEEYNDLFENYKFDEKGNLIYQKDYDDTEKYYEYDGNNNLIYYKDSNGFDEYSEYDENNNKIHCKRSADGYETWYEYDENNNLIHFKDSDNFEYWQVFDENSNLKYFKDSLGIEESYEYDEETNELKEEKRKDEEKIFDENNNLIYYKDWNREYSVTIK